MHNVLKHQQGVIGSFESNPIPQNLENSGIFYIVGHSKDALKKDIYIWKLETITPGANDQNRANEIKAMTDNADPIKIKKVTEFPLGKNVQTGWAQLVPFYKPENLNFKHTILVTFADFDKDQIGICETGLETNIGVTQVCKSVKKPDKKVAINTIGCNLLLKGCYFALSAESDPDAKKLTYYEFFQYKEQNQVPYKSVVEAKDITLAVDDSIIALDKKNWVKKFGFNKLTKFNVDLSKLTLSSKTLVIFKDELDTKTNKVKETKYEISFSTVENLFKGFKHPTTVRKQVWYLNEFFQIPIDPVMYSGNAMQFDINGKDQSKNIDKIQVGDNPTNIFLDQMDIPKGIKIPKNVQLFIYDDMTTVHYPDGNITFMNCGIKDNNVISYHCLPLYVIVPKKYERIKYSDTLLNQLGIMFTDFGNKYETRMVFHVIG